MAPKLLKSLLLCLAVSVAAPAEGRDLRAVARTLKAPSRPPTYLLTADANQVAHVAWNGKRLWDAKGNGWVAAGTPTMVPAASPVPAGAQFSAANYYVLGTGNDVLDFAGVFSVCIVFKPATTGVEQVLLSDGAYNAGGYQFAVASSGAFAQTQNANVGTTVNTVVLNEVNIACGGRSNATTILTKLNLGAVHSRTFTTTAATSTPARIGIDALGLKPTGATVYEVWVSSTAASDAAFIAMANTVKTALGITAW